MEFEVVGIEAVGIGDAEGTSYSAKVWGQRPEEVAFVPAGSDWTQDGRFYGSRVRTREVENPAPAEFSPFGERETFLEVVEK